VSILVAAAAGAISPLCSCSVIPAIAGLLRAGTPFGPLMAFWIASPSMDPEIFALSTARLSESLPEIAKLSGVMLLAFFLEAIVIRFVPVELVAPLLGKGSIFSVPLYATNLAVLGLVSGLLAKGMSEGAALAFLFGGAATTIPAMTAVWSLVKPKVFALYLGTIIAAALASGWIWEVLGTLVSF
jgi:uncharacterized membrane protein YraQ (UPF0718 family)